MDQLHLTCYRKPAMVIGGLLVVAGLMAVQWRGEHLAARVAAILCGSFTSVYADTCRQLEVTRRAPAIRD